MLLFKFFKNLAKTFSCETAHYLFVFARYDRFRTLIQNEIEAEKRYQSASDMIKKSLPLKSSKSKLFYNIFIFILTLHPPQAYAHIILLMRLI